MIWKFSIRSFSPAHWIRLIYSWIDSRARREYTIEANGKKSVDALGSFHGWNQRRGRNLIYAALRRAEDCVNRHSLDVCPTMLSIYWKTCCKLRGFTWIIPLAHAICRVQFTRIPSSIGIGLTIDHRSHKTAINNRVAESYPSTTL